VFFLVDDAKIQKKMRQTFGALSSTKEDLKIIDITILDRAPHPFKELCELSVRTAQRPVEMNHLLTNG
jgi:hypothetical protein